MNDDKKLRLRECMIKEKLFLKNLYLGNPLSNRRTLSFSTPLQLNILINIFYYIVIGEIPLKKNHFEKLGKSKKRRIMHNRLNTHKKFLKVRM